jgi:8-oxo-dGTP pyrophosphatase MutT (NUDIX family)
MFDAYQWEQELFDGTKAVFEQLKRPDTAITIPVTTDGRIVMLEEQQPGRMSSIIFPGGRIDPDEDPLKAAKRELLEETGYATDEDLIFWEAIQPVSKLDWAVYTFVARGCYKAREPMLDAGEKIQVRLATFEEMVNVGADPSHRAPEIELKFMRAKYDTAEAAKLKTLLGLK